MSPLESSGNLVKFTRDIIHLNIDAVIPNRQDKLVWLFTDNGEVQLLS